MKTYSTRTLELLKQAGIPQPRHSCSRLILAAQAAAFLLLFAACADAALDAAVYETDSTPRPTPAEIAQICEAEDYASDACIEWAAVSSTH